MKPLLAGSIGKTARGISLYELLLWLQLPLFAGLFYYGGTWAVKWLDQPLENISMVGTFGHTDKSGLRQLVWNQVEKRYLEIDLADVKQALEAHPWIHQVDVRRQWPTGLKVKVTEEIPVARWGDQGLLNSEGRVFVPQQIDGAGENLRVLKERQFQELPKLLGPESRTLTVMEQFRSLNQQMKPLQLQLSSLELEPRGAWSLTLNNGIRMLLGRGDVVNKMHRFSRVYDSQLANHADKIKQIDVRYTNGLTVTWRQPPKAQS
ncbi:cell division protein FtsQ/DivIB [Motiliproteus sp. MSK22-1]|uniref:cell division protein FtsQ/DivIB n=1 Tax=Motiliproteus sp. MSK22-1 TaxID=1897630 RepID=UPI00097664A3|nr:cell division protein FtsQ/DivIB [Motiliproteus sp. MSK22-1]OMH36555.1 hypothetical protein BGP75_09380 [Motiliproteus sp. MSK22-1]